MSLSRQLQIGPAALTGGGDDLQGAAEPSPEEKRFNALIAQIEQARATLASWQEQIPVFHRAYDKRIVPLLGQLREARRASIELVDALLDRPGWSRAEAASLRDWLLDRVGEFLEGDGAALAIDPALRAVFAKHGGVEPGSAAPRATGESIDAGDTGGGDEADDAAFVRRVEEELAAQAARQAEAREQAQAAAKAARTANARQKGRSAAQQRRDAAAEEAVQSVREVFRKLVSALHPDREPDADRRVQKTLLMQRANAAYAARDLLALLQLQLEIAQVDASFLRGASSQRVRQFNQALAAQLAEMKAEIQRVQRQFEADFGLGADGLLNPSRLDRLVDRAYRDVSALLADQEREIRILADRSATRQWLKVIGRDPYR